MTSEDEFHAAVEQVKTLVVDPGRPPRRDADLRRYHAAGGRGGHTLFG